MSLIQALNATLKEMFRENPDTYIWGQDVAYKEKGGIFNVTKGMQQEFGAKRVFNGPIAEDFILGTADGFSRLEREDPRRRRGRRVRRLLLARGRADGRDVARVLAHERAVRPERHDPDRLGRLHRRRPLPLAEHRGLAHDAPRDPRRRPRLRGRRGGAAPDGDPLARHHGLPRAEVPLQLRAGQGARAGGLRRAVRQGAPPPRRAPT